MKLCSTSHREICFNGKLCPLCECIAVSKADIGYLEIGIENLNRENEELHDRIVELEKVISEFNFKNIE
jgi:hypothetical protein